MKTEEERKEALLGVLRKRQIYNCVECGKCSSVCPIGQINESFYPRIIMRKALHENPDLMDDGLLWSCLNCGRCDEICDLDVHFYELIQDLRAECRNWGGYAIYPPHNGGPHAWMKMMASSGINQNRFDWINSDLKIQTTGDVLYFVGCLPYYDNFFEKLKPDTLSIATSTIKILNKLGIEPAIMKNERCCGHDLLWGGDVEEYQKLAQINMEEIKKTKAKKVITSCAECYHTLKTEYPKIVGNLEVEVVHISEFLSENLANIKLKKLDKNVSFQDPCRLGRLSGIYDEPRNIIKAIDGVELHEMQGNRASGVCCGTSGWVSCGAYSKQIQNARLKEAKATGADLLITSCPKCQIHFKCALSDRKMEEDSIIEIQDLTTLVSRCLT